MPEYEKVKTFKCYVTEDLHNKFRKKIAAEGWTIQQALALLIKSYVEDDFNIEDEE